MKHGKRFAGLIMALLLLGLTACGGDEMAISEGNEETYQEGLAAMGISGLEDVAADEPEVQVNEMDDLYPAEHMKELLDRKADDAWVWYMWGTQEQAASAETAYADYLTSQGYELVEEDTERTMRFFSDGTNGVVINSADASAFYDDQYVVEVTYCY